MPSIIKVDQIQSDTGSINLASSISGNLTFSGIGNRITGDFSNGTFSNRVAFQSSTTNGNTLVAAIPNGTSTTAGLWVYNNSDLTNAGRFRFTIGSSDAALTVDYNGSGTYLPLTMATGGSERLRITTAGVVELTSGQLKFPASQNASTDPNTLDDYEEGTWTPELVAIGGSFTVNPTYSARSGTYTKVGRFVYCNFTMTLASKGTSTGGPLMGIGGFPFTVGAGVSATGNFYFDALGVNWIHIELQPRAGNTNGYIVGLTAAATSTAYMFHANNIADTTIIAGNFMFAV